MQKPALVHVVHCLVFLTVMTVFTLSTGWVASVQAQSRALAPLGRSSMAERRMLAPSVSCGSGTNSWTGSAGDNQWTTATNWSSGAVPVSTDNVCIASTFTSTITIGSLSTTNQTIASLDAGAPLSETEGPLTIAGTATLAANLAVSGTLTLNGTSSMTTLQQSTGTLSGTGTLTVSGLLTWSGGTESGTGVTNANGGMTITGEPFLDTRTVNNSGTATWNGTAFFMENAAVFNNMSGATWNHENDSAIDNGGGSPTFNNAGTFEKTGGTSTTGGGVGSSVIFNHTGVVLANSGILYVMDNGSCTTTCGGSWSVGSGSTLQLGSGTAAALSGPISGAGTVVFPSGTVNYTGTYDVTGGTQVTNGTANFTAPVSSVGPLTLSGGTLNFSTGKTVTTSAVNQSTGTLTGSDMLTVTGAVTWSGGTESGTGVTNANGGMTITGEPFLDTRTINNKKTATWNGTAFFMENAAVFNNMSGATWNHENDSAIDNGGGSPTFKNAGTFEKTGGTSTSGGGVGSSITFNNSGTVISKSGILLLGNLYTQSGGSTELDGGSISISGSATLTENGGSVLGSGIITGGLTNTAGTVSPTLTPNTAGTLSLSSGSAGYYTQGTKGTLLLDIAGSSTDQFDVLSATGAATLAGSAQLCLIKGFKPKIGSTFPLLTYASETGTFSTVNFGWSFSYGATSATATYSGAPVDSFSPTSLSFPSQLINTTSSPLTETLTNNGQATLTISSITLIGTDASNYKIASNSCTSSLAVGTSCSVTVTFTPSALGTRSASLLFTDDACASPHTIPITGKGTEITLAPSPVAFGSQTVGTTSAPMTVTVTNNGTTSVTVTKASIAGTDKGDFAITSNNCKTLSAGGTCTINITFTPGAEGARTGSLSLTDNDKGSPQTDVLTGTGS
jgi:hypothetical protein